MLSFSLKQIVITVGIGILSLFVLGSLIGGNKSEIQTPSPTPVPQNIQPSETVVPPSPIEKPVSQKINDGTLLVTRVIDGDTIELENGQRVRYIGIDTPETVDPRKPVQCFGIEASNKNKQLVERKRVRLEKDITDTDKYGRLLRYVYTDNAFINLILVQEGFAHSYTYPPDVKYQNEFVGAERMAREQKKGLWESCPVTLPAPSPIPTPQPAPTPIPTPTPIPPTSSCVIKGNISSSGEKIYHVPGCGNYNVTKIDEARGERWFCTESEALGAGWRKALNCP